MGNYTELIFGCALKKDTPKEVIDTLSFYCGEHQDESKVVFKTKSGRNPLNNGGSYYFGVINTNPNLQYDNIRNSWFINSRTNLKNYENEIDDFLSWIKPYIDQGSGEREMYAIVTYESGEPIIYYLDDAD